MAVKSVKKFFLEIFWTIANLKLIFVTCRSVSVMTRPSSFPLQLKPG